MQVTNELNRADLLLLFQDSITIIQCVVIEYSWIDSLCIVQDDENGWKEESANMADIYSNSTICISDTFAIDYSGTCFTHRESS